MEIQHLRTFKAVAQYESIRKTAEILGYSPAAISQHITQLQKDTGVQLFEKVGRGLKITYAGALFLNRLDGFFREYSNLETYIAGLREKKESVFSCYYITSFGASVIPQVLHQISQEFPCVRFDLHLNDLPQITESPQPDLQLVVEQPGFTAPDGFTLHHLLTEPYSVALPQEHPLAQHSTPLSLDDLKDDLWIDVEPAKGWCWQTLVNSCESAGFYPNFHVQAYDYPMGLQLAASGLGICVLPRIGAQNPIKEVAIRELNETGPRRTVSALVPSRRGDSAVALRMIELLRNTLTQPSQQGRTRHIENPQHKDPNISNFETKY